MNLTAVAVMVVSYVALITAHEVGDHWFQTPCQAMTKGGTGWTARGACARHVATLTASKVATMLVPFLMFHLPIRPLWWAIGLGIDAVSHYWADRRTTLRRLAESVGKGGFYDLGAPRPGHNDNATTGTGAYLLDQSWHKFFLYLMVLILAGGAR